MKREGGRERRGEGRRNERRRGLQQHGSASVSMHGQTCSNNIMSHCCCFAHHVEGVRKARIVADATCVIKIVQLLPAAAEENNGPP